MPDHVTSEILDRLPPQNLEAEKGVLGAIFLDPKSLDRVADFLKPEAFYADANQRIYKHLLQMHEGGGRIDLLLFRERLIRAGDFEVVGGAAYLAEVAQSVPVSANAVFYARVVARAAKFRGIIHSATSMLRDAYEASQEPEEVLNAAEASLAEVRTDETGAGPMEAKDAAFAALERIYAIANRKEGFGVATGLSTYDEHWGGLFPGELHILAARPSVGKSSLACQIADHCGEKGRLVYFASLEMSAVELATKTICSLCGVNSKAIRTASLKPKETEALAEAANRYATRSVVLDARPRMTVYDLRRAARRLVKRGLALIVIDYLQLITSQDRRIPRHEQVGQTTRGLKALAGELNVPVLCLAQLNREADKLDFPTLANLRESGDIEQDADVVMFLCRPEGGIEDKETMERYAAELRIAKYRNGDTGIIRLGWDGSRTRFDVPQRIGYEEFGEFS